MRVFEGVFKHDFARGAQIVPVSEVQNFFGQDKQDLHRGIVGLQCGIEGLGCVAERFIWEISDY